jgi:predicted enzyme related to lactoylglutathione lyase
MPDAQSRGRFVWYDLMTPDSAAAQRFYTEIIGWGTQKWEGPMKYTMWTNGGQPVGGVMDLPKEAQAEGAPPHWLAYIATPNVDATADEATKAGATILHPPTDIPEVGRFAVLRDPQGAVFAIFTANDDAAPAAEPKVGEFSWHELVTTDPDGAWKFYSNLFGWDKMEAMDMGPMGVYQMYGTGGQMLGGIMKKPAEMPFPPHWMLYARVRDLNDVLARVSKLGGQVLNGPMEVPGGSVVAQCLDPQGGAFALHQQK